MSLWVKPPDGDFTRVTTSATDIDGVKRDVISQLSLPVKLPHRINVFLSDESGIAVSAALKPFHSLAAAGLAGDAFVVITYTAEAPAAAGERQRRGPSLCTPRNWR